MQRLELPQILLAALGMLSQKKESGILVLEQNDGFRRMEWSNGSIIYLQSDVAGEQIGNFLLRKGVIDFPVLNAVLKDESERRFGDKIVELGLLTPADRDLHLQSLIHSVMVNVLEHPVLSLEWVPEWRGEPDLYRLSVGHKQFIWDTVQQANIGDSLCDMLYKDPDWRWISHGDLLSGLSDLPLTPQMAYSLSFLGAEPLGFETFLSLCGMDEETAAKFFASLWSLGQLDLVKGDMPLFEPERSLASKESTESDLKRIFSEKSPNQKPPLPVPEASVPKTPETPTVKPPSPPTQPPEPAPTPPVLDFTPPSEALPNSEPETPSTTGLPDQETMAEDPSKPDFKIKARKFYNKAKALIIQERFSEAVKLLEQSVKLDGESEDAFDVWLLLGKQRMENPAWSTRAIEALQTASRLKPAQGEPWALMGNLYQRKGFKNNAVACFKKALDIDPSVEVPAELNLTPEAPEEEIKENKGLLGKFKSILGGK